MVLVKYLIPIAVVFLSLFSCSNEPSLQKYLIEKQDDNKFMKIDLSSSLLQSKNSSFTPEQQEILNTIKKVNIVAYNVDQGGVLEYEAKKEELSSIMSQDKYKTLITVGSNDKGVTLKYLGEEDAMDEVVIFASDNEKGFAVFRLLGEKMRPDQMIVLMSSFDNGDLDLSQLSGIGELFDI